LIATITKFVRTRLEPYSRRPLAALLRVFAGRVFHGGESSDASVDVALAVVVILLAMPGLLVSLLLFEKYGSLLRWMRGDGSFDPFTATIPDEYFFIVLSMVVAGAAALWRWDALFLDRRDYTNLVPLPISLRKIFFANLGAIFLLAGGLTLDVNAASVVLFPIVVTGSQPSLLLLLRFGAGHAVTVFLSSAFSFFSVFAIVGLLMALLPYSAFRRVSIYIRFLMALFFLALLATGFAVPTFLTQLTQLNKQVVLALPPVWFIGICEMLWGNGGNPYYAGMAHSAVVAIGTVACVALASYSLSFRRSFVRIPETAAVSPLPRTQFRLFPPAWFDRTVLRDLSHRGCFHFIARTLFRSEAHLQMLSAFVATGLIASAQSLATSFQAHAKIAAGAAASGSVLIRAPSEDLLSIPFILAFCIIVGLRLAFEIPSELRANWIFALLIDSEKLQARSVARKVLLAFALIPLVPPSLASSWILWGPVTALLHTAIFACCTIAFVELVLVRFRKIPFTCTYPPFHSHSALLFVAYVFGFVAFTGYVPELELWSMAEPWRTLVFVPLIALLFASVHQYRKQMLDMDKQLIFEEPSASVF